MSLQGKLKKTTRTSKSLTVYIMIVKSSLIQSNNFKNTRSSWNQKSLICQSKATKSKHPFLKTQKRFKFSRRDEDFGVKEKQQVQELKAVESQMTNIAGIDGRKS